jgi:hypothetical protein
MVQSWLHHVSLIAYVDWHPIMRVSLREVLCIRRGGMEILDLVPIANEEVMNQEETVNDNLFVQLLNNSADEWKLTLESFIKFQLRRQAHPTAGAVPLKKNLLKILTQQTFSKEELIFASLHQNSVIFLRRVLRTTEEYVTIHEEIRNQVVENAKSLFEEIKDSYLSQTE